MLHPTIKQKIESAIDKLAAEGRWFTPEQLASFYENFRAKYGPEVLAGLEGTALLYALHGSKSSREFKKDSLAYWLEWKDDDEFPRHFGSIGGGSAHKFGLYINASEQWVTGSANKPRIVSEQEAVLIAQEQRDQFLRGCKLLDELPSYGTDEDYRELQKNLLEVSPDVCETAWGHKYFSLLYPDKLEDFQVEHFQRFNLIKLLQTPPEGHGRYLSGGRYVAIANELGLEITRLTTALCEIGCVPYHYWRIGTTVGDTNESYWEPMREGNYVSIGWRELGDLSESTEGYQSKEHIKQLLNDITYPNKPQVAGTKANEIFHFISTIATGDLVIASEGERVRGIAKITGPYVYREELDFPHCRPVEWLNLDEWKVPVSKGLLRTTVREVHDPNNMVEIERRVCGGVTLQKRYWVELTYVKGHPDREEGKYKLGAALWSPQLGKNGQKYYAYENLKKVQHGDIILHLPDSKGFSGVSIAARTADSEFTCPEGTVWEGVPGYLVLLQDYRELKEPLSREEFLYGPVYDKLSALHDNYGGLFYYKSNHQLTSGAYLTEAPLEVVSVLNKAYKEKTGADLPHITVDGPESKLKEVIRAYGRAAKKAADGTLVFKYLDFASEERQNTKLKQLFQKFLDEPNEGNLQAFWNKDYIKLTLGGGSVGHLLLNDKNDIPKIHDQLAQLNRSDEFNEGWENALKVHWALWELWGRIKDKPQVWYGWNGVQFFGSKTPQSYVDFLRKYEDFLVFYSDVLGTDHITSCNSELEIDRLFSFIDSVKRLDIESEVRELGDPDVERLYNLTQDLIRDSTTSHSWIFQANPDIFDLLSFLKRGGEESWSIRQQRQHVSIGDKVYYWKAGKNAGIYGIGTIFTPPEKDVSESGKWTVVTHIEAYLGDSYISREDFVANPILKDSLIIRQPQGTNFLLKSEESKEIEQILRRREEKRDKPKQPRYSLEEFSAETGFTTDTIASWLRKLKRKQNVIFQGPPGTGKTYVAERLARLLISESKGCYDVIQLHPAYTYEDFMQGIKPTVTESGLFFEVKNGRFLDFCQKALKAEEHCQEATEAGADAPCVLIIDEINRANLARVFGELMYLLEYRDETIPLAYGDRFQIPQNVYIIGTMNTADRSIALVDHALRRRFSFIFLAPNYEVLRQQLAASDLPADSLVELLRTVNEKINDIHYEVGISFFLKDEENLRSTLQDIWQGEIEPYLEEYFYDTPDAVKPFRWHKLINTSLKDWASP